MILVDDQGGPKSSVSLIPFLPPELTKRARLESGDAAWFGHGPEGLFTLPIGVEYKTVSELIGCITNRRFVGEQFPKMCNLYQRIYFIIEGEYDEGPDGTLVVPVWRSGKLHWESRGWAMSYRQFDNWQNSLTESGKIRFKRSRTKSESAAQLLDLYFMWTKAYDEHKSLFSFDKSQLPPLVTRPTVKRLVAAQIPGIGWELSQRAAEHFPTTVDLVTADVDEWCKIRGIGKSKALKIWGSLRRPNE